MYTQGLDQKGKSPQQSDSLESPEQLEAFQQRIDAEDFESLRQQDEFIDAALTRYANQANANQQFERSSKPNAEGEQELMFRYCLAVRESVPESEPQEPDEVTEGETASVEVMQGTATQDITTQDTATETNATDKQTTDNQPLNNRSPGSSPSVVMLTESGPLVGLLLVDVRGKDWASQQALNRISLLTAGVVSGLLAILLFWYITIRIILEPVRLLKNCAQKVAQGDMGIRAQIDTGDEFEQLAKMFNTMLSSILQSFLFFSDSFFQNLIGFLLKFFHQI